MTVSNVARLWYTSPASRYTAGLPLGTGRLAAMVLGDPLEERIALNHEWLWRGVHRNRETERRAHRLAEVRSLLLDGRYDEGTRKGDEAFGGPGGGSGSPGRVDSYQPAGDLHFAPEHGAVTDYRRSLDLDSGLAEVTYAADGNRFTRQYLAHLEDDLLLIRLTAEKPFSGRLWLDRVADSDCFLLSRAAGDRLRPARIRVTWKASARRSSPWISARPRGARLPKPSARGMDRPPRNAATGGPCWPPAAGCMKGCTAV